MFSATQMMNNTTEVEYISIYEQRPRKRMGRPKTCTLTEEQKKQKAIERALKYYYDNHEYCKLQQRSYKRAIRASKKNEV